MSGIPHLFSKQVTRYVDFENMAVRWKTPGRASARSRLCQTPLVLEILQRDFVVQSVLHPTLQVLLWNLLCAA